MRGPGIARVRVWRARERPGYGRRGLPGDAHGPGGVRRAVQDGGLRRAAVQEAELPGVRGLLPEERPGFVGVGGEADSVEDRDIELRGARRRCTGGERVGRNGLTGTEKEIGRMRRAIYQFVPTSRHAPITSLYIWMTEVWL